MANRHLPDVANAWLRGAAAGAVATVPWTVGVMLGARGAHRGPLTPLWASAAALTGTPSPRTAGAAVGGLLLQVLVSTALGAAWTGLVGRYLRPTAAAVGGAVAGLGAWLVLTWLLLPVVAPALLTLTEDFPVAWLAAHLAWGVVLGLMADALEPPALLRAAPPFGRWFRRGRARARA